MDNIPPLPQSAQPQAAPPSGRLPAGFWIRAGAYTIDGIVIAIPQFILIFILTMAGIPSVFLNILSLGLQVAYYTWMPVAFNGQTVGKMAAGVAIIRTDGSGLSYGRAFGRWVGYWLSLLPVGLGFAAAGFTENKRALHDYVADTRVVYIQTISTGRKAAVIICGLIIPLIMILGIAAAIALPGLLGAQGKALDAATKGNLGALRSATSIFYGDAEGVSPKSLDQLTEGGRYLPEIPKLRTSGHHPETNAVEFYGRAACSKGGDISGAGLKDSGKWGYVADPRSSCYGMVFVDCTHKDTKGKEWYSY